MPSRDGGLRPRRAQTAGNLFKILSYLRWWWRAYPQQSASSAVIMCSRWDSVGFQFCVRTAVARVDFGFRKTRPIFIMPVDEIENLLVHILFFFPLSDLLTERLEKVSGHGMLARTNELVIIPVFSPAEKFTASDFLSPSWMWQPSKWEDTFRCRVRWPRSEKNARFIKQPHRERYL